MIFYNTHKTDKQETIIKNKNTDSESKMRKI